MKIKFLPHHSIRFKLIVVVLSTTLVTVLLCGWGFFLFEQDRGKNEAISSAKVISEITARTIGAAVVFKDGDNIRLVLAALSNNRETIRAAVYDRDQNIIASFTNDSSPPLSSESDFFPASLEPNTYLFLDHSLLVAVPIEVGSETVGTIKLEYSLSKLNLLMDQFRWFFISVILLGTVAAAIVALSVSQILARPLLALSNAMSLVSKSKDYAIRVTHAGYSELEELYSGFNLMLEELGKRDIALQESRDNLELRVSERTEKLQTEINEREKVEVALLREQQVLRSVVRNAPVAMAMFDIEMKYTTYSYKWLEEYGLGMSDLQGRSFYDVMPNTPARWRDIHREALNGLEQECSEDMLELAQGQVVFLRWAIQPWFMPDGQQGGIIIVSARIDDLVTARHEAMHTAQLKAQFLTNVSHELRTPLNGILGLTELLLDETHLDEDTRDSVSTIHSSGKLLLALINDLLDLSRLEHDKVELQQEVFDIRELVHETIALVEQSAKKKGLSIELFSEKDVPSSVIGDSFRIRQLLLNLLANAVKFTEFGKVSAAIRVNELSNDFSVLSLEVSDTGIGIDSDKLKNIFQPFAQADGSITRQFGGTGLGLAISEQLARLMNGVLTVVSNPGQGSTFSFRAKFAHPAASENRSVNHNREVSQDSGKRTRPLNILVAEDNLVNQHVIRSLLTKDGHQVTIVSNGLEAVDAVNRAPFDLVLMDLQMPFLGGLDATQQIRKFDDELKRTIPVIALTAHAFDEQRLDALEAGVNAYLTKPIDRNLLREALRKFSRRRSKTKDSSSTENSSTESQNRENLVSS